MAADSSRDLIDKLTTLAVGLGVCAAGGGAAASAIGAAQLAVSGGIGVGAMAAGRAIAGRKRDDDIARDVFEKTIVPLPKSLGSAGSVDQEAFAHVASQLTTFLDRVEFPVSDLKNLVDQSRGGDTLADGLADSMVARLRDIGADLREEKYAALAREILSNAVRAGLSATQSIQTELVVALGHRAVEDVRAEAEKTREAIRKEGTASAARDAEILRRIEKASEDDVVGHEAKNRSRALEYKDQIRTRIYNTFADVAEKDWTEFEILFVNTVVDELAAWMKNRSEDWGNYHVVFLEEIKEFMPPNIFSTKSVPIDADLAVPRLLKSGFSMTFPPWRTVLRDRDGLPRDHLYPLDEEFKSRWGGWIDSIGEDYDVDGWPHQRFRCRFWVNMYGFDFSHASGSPLVRLLRPIWEYAVERDLEHYAWQQLSNLHLSTTLFDFVSYNYSDCGRLYCPEGG